MSRRESDIAALVSLQEAAKRVMVVIKRHKKRKCDPPEMPPIPSALLTTEEINDFLEEYTFYVYRSDTNAVLARGIQGFEAAKARANQIRQSHGLKWDQVKFKAERGTQAGTGAGSSATSPKKQFGVSRDGKTFTNAQGQRSPVEYSRHVNPSKGRRFRGYTDAQGNYHDID